MSEIKLTPILAKEEYIEQAYFFRICRERIADGRPAQEVVTQVHAELLSTTQLPFAVEFMGQELRHTGMLAPAFAKIAHYFTPFQAHVIEEAERDESRFTFEQAMRILEREAQFRSEEPTAAGLFVYELEAISRNRLGYGVSLRCMAQDGFFSQEWRDYIGLVRSQIDVREFSELIFARSQHFVNLRRKTDPEYQAHFPIMFSEKEGMIALANRGKDPMYLFATLQRQLGYPEVPRPLRGKTFEQEFLELTQKLKMVETRLSIVEQEARGTLDISQFYVKKDESLPPPRDDD